MFFFANSSDRLHKWFLGTKLYQKHPDSFVKKRGMLLSTKISIITTVTLLMGFGFFMMARKSIWILCMILAVVWLVHKYLPPKIQERAVSLGITTKEEMTATSKRNKLFGFAVMTIVSLVIICSVNYETTFWAGHISHIFSLMRFLCLMQL